MHRGVNLQVSGKMCDTACLKYAHMHIHRGVNLQVSGKMCETALCDAACLECAYICTYTEVKLEA